MIDRDASGVLDTSAYIDLGLLDPASLPLTPELTAITMASIYVALRAMLYGAPRVFIGGQLLMAVPLGMALGL